MDDTENRVRSDDTTAWRCLDNAVPIMDTWASIPPLTYRLTDEEILTGSQPQAQQSRWLKTVWLANAFIQILSDGIRLYTHRTAISVWVGGLQISIGILFGF